MVLDLRKNTPLLIRNTSTIIIIITEKYDGIGRGCPIVLYWHNLALIFVKSLWLWLFSLFYDLNRTLCKTFVGTECIVSFQYSLQSYRSWFMVGSYQNKIVTNWSILTIFGQFVPMPSQFVYIRFHINLFVLIWLNYG